jgi:hypothetical protein
MAVAGPVGIEHRAFGRNLDVAGERGHDLVVPQAIGETGQGSGVEHGFGGMNGGIAA